MIFQFTYRSGPDWMTPKLVIQDYTNEKIAEAFADGLRRGGAGNVSFKELKPISPDDFLCVVCNSVPVDVMNGFDTCKGCTNKV